MKRKLKAKNSITYFTLVQNVIWMSPLPLLVGLVFGICKGVLFPLTNCTSLDTPSARIQKPTTRNAYWMRLSFVTCSKLSPSMLIVNVEVVTLFAIVTFSWVLKVFVEDNKGRTSHGTDAAKSERKSMAPCRTDGLFFPIITKHSVDTAEIKEID